MHNEVYALNHCANRRSRAGALQKSPG